MDSTACAHQAHLTCTHAGRGCDCWCHTDYRRAEADQTSAEARQAEAAGAAWMGLALVLAVLAGATGGSTLGAALAALILVPVALAWDAWMRAADDRDLAGWLGGAA